MATMPPLTGNYYEILGIPTTATPEHVERAYRYHASLYSESSVATYSLLDPNERQQARAQVQEAYDVLKDPLRRRAYDGSQGIASVMAPAPVRTAGAEEAAAAATVTLSGPVTGAALRGLREGRGISLEQIAVKSKVGLRYLQYIEGDRHAELPARVYLRGFLMEYARALGLEPGVTADAYLASMKR
jgi:flagellar biosynthesis protein FlhG